VDRSDERLPNLPEVGLGRRQFLRGVAATGAVVGAGGLLAACSSSGSGAKPSASAASKVVKRYGGNLKVGMSGGSSSDTLDPLAGLTEVDTSRSECLYQSLVKLDKQAQIYNVLATEFEPSKDYRQWVIKIRPGVYFHSGKELTADDVVYTFHTIISQDLEGTSFLGPIDIKGVKALSKYQVLVPMHKPFNGFVGSLAGAWYYLYIIPAGFNPAKLPPDGTGPFTYQSFTAGQRSVFVKNKNYWKPGRPYLDAVTIIDFSDNTAVQDSLTTGAIDCAGQLDPPQIPALSTTSGVKTVVSQTGQFKPFTMRVDKPPFHDVNVRQAMRLLVDRPQLIESALNGYGVPASDVFAPYDPDFDHSLHREQDIPQARFLLKKAGMEGLHVTLTTSALESGMVAMATVFAEQAAAAGVTVKLQQVDPGTFFATGKYLNWTFSQDYYSYAPYLSQVSQSFLPNAPFNETHTNDPYYTGLYWQANAATDPGKKRQIMYAMQEYDFTKGGYIIPTFPDTLDAYSTKMTGYTTSKVGESLSNWAFEEFSFV
jgi:peptide/nickel transport system substrate-binding protein